MSQEYVDTSQGTQEIMEMAVAVSFGSGNTPQRRCVLQNASCSGEASRYFMSQYGNVFTFACTSHMEQINRFYPDIESHELSNSAIAILEVQMS